MSSVKEAPIKSLLIIAGHSSIGKSTFVNSLLRGRLPQLSEQLGIGNPADWELTYHSELKMFLAKSKPDNLIIHVDISHFISTAKINLFSQVIRDAEDVIVLTLTAPRQTLRKRSIKRIVRQARSLSKPRKGYLWEVYLFQAYIYRLGYYLSDWSNGWIEKRYSLWFGFLRSFGTERFSRDLILDIGGPNTLDDPDRTAVPREVET